MLRYGEMHHVLSEERVCRVVTCQDTPCEKKKKLSGMKVGVCCGWNGGSLGSSKRSDIEK